MGGAWHATTKRQPFFFHAAAEQGAGRRRTHVAGSLAAAPARCPECMRPAPQATTKAAPPGVDYQAIAPRKIVEMVHKMAPQYQVEPQLALAIIATRVELQPPGAITPECAGLMQLIQRPAGAFGSRTL